MVAPVKDFIDQSWTMLSMRQLKFLQLSLALRYDCLLHSAGVVAPQKGLKPKIGNFEPKKSFKRVKLLRFVSFPGIKLLDQVIVYFFRPQILVVAEIYQNHSRKIVTEFFLSVIILLNLSELNQLLQEVEIFKVDAFLRLLEAQHNQIAHHHQETASNFGSLVQFSEGHFVYYEN